MGESGDRLLLQFLVPCDGLVCDGVRGCAGFFPDELSGAPAHHRRVAKLSQGGVKRQDAKTGVWWQVMDQGDRKGNFLEATASTMFVYALAKGVNHGYLSHGYVPAI